MEIKFNRWLTPPVFDDEEKTWRASLLNATIIFSTIIIIFVIIGNLAGGKIKAPVLIIDGIMLAILILLRWLLFKGKVNLTGILLIAIGIIIISSATASIGTIRTPTTSVFLLLVILAGMLFGLKGLILSTISCSIAIFGLILAENLSFLPRPDYSVNITQWVTYTGLFALTGTLTYFSNISTVQALTRIIKESTERKEAEEKLRESEERVNTILMFTQAGILIVDEKSRNILFANAAAANMARTTPEAMIGKLCHNYICPAEEGSCPIIDLGKKIESTERTLIRQDGSECPVLKSVKSFMYQGRPCLLETFIDITELTEAKFERENYLAELEKNRIVLINMMEDAEIARAETMEANLQLDRIKKAVDSSADAIALATPEAHHFYQNETFTRMFGYTLKEFQTMRPQDRYADSNVAEEVFSSIMTGGSCDREVEMISKDGRHFPVLLRANAVKNDKGEIVALSGVHIDITERKQAEEKMKKYMLEIENINNKLENYTYTVSHDLKEPIRSIKTFSQFILEDHAESFNEKAKKDFNKIINASTRMTIMIDDLLTLSRIGKENVEYKKINVSEIIKDAESILYSQIGKTKSKIIISKMPEITCQPVWITSVFQNLISNSIKYSDKNNTVIEISYKELDDHYEFSVKDDSRGIEKKYQNKIFELFRKGHKGRDVEGSGAGLAIVQSVIAEHKGNVWIDWSEPGQGTNIKFTISKTANSKE